MAKGPISPEVAKILLEFHAGLALKWYNKIHKTRADVGKLLEKVRNSLKNARNLKSSNTPVSMKINGTRIQAGSIRKRKPNNGTNGNNGTSMRVNNNGTNGTNSAKQPNAKRPRGVNKPPGILGRLFGTTPQPQLPALAPPTPGRYYP